MSDSLFLEPMSAARLPSGAPQPLDNSSRRRVRTRRPRAERDPGTNPDSPTANIPVLRAPAEGVPPLIDQPATLSEAANTIQGGVGPIAVDTERAQGYRYGGGAYLVQIRRPEAGSFLIDSHVLPDLSVLSAAMDEEWILHAADQDLACLKDLGLVPPSIFDTEIAARLLGFQRFSLGAMTEQLLNIHLEKSHQNEDWSLRPLPVDWLRYAALDVELLGELRDELLLRLADAGRTDWANQEFAHELASPLVAREPDWRDLKGLGKIRSRSGLAIAKELWSAREELGRDLDVSPGRVLSTKGIIEAALKEPKSKSQLSSIEAFRRPKARKYAAQWWGAVSRARALPDAERPALRRPRRPDYIPGASVWKRNDPAAWKRLQAVRSWVDRAASPLGIDPAVVLTPKIQRAIAWEPLTGDLEAALASAGARPWQMQQVLPVASRQLLSDLRH